MVERIRYYLERLYPYLISGFVLIIVHMWHIDFTDNTDLKEVLNGIVTLDSIILGFLGAIMPVILSMKNESKFVKYVFQKDKQHLFVKYLKITVLTGIVNAVISLSMHLRGNMSDNIRKVVYYSWIFTTLLFVILTYRCMSHMITLVFKTDEENEDGLERKHSTRVPKEREEDLKKHFK